MTETKIEPNVHEIERIPPDVEKYFEEFKNKFIEVDLLHIEEDVKPDQKWYVMSFVEADPSFAALNESFCTEKFLEHFGARILEECVQGKHDWNFYHRKYKEFKTVNFTTLRNEFKKRYGNHYDSIRMLKFYRAFKTKKEAQTYAANKAKNNKFFDIVIIEAGKWAPYKPTQEMCKDTEWVDERMNKLMHSHIYHKQQALNYLEARKQYHLEKSLNSKKISFDTINLLKQKYQSENRFSSENHLEKYVNNDNQKQIYEKEYHDTVALKMKDTTPNNIKALIDIEMQTDNIDILDPETVLNVTKDPAKALKVLNARLKRYKEFEENIKIKEKELLDKEYRIKLDIADIKNELALAKKKEKEMLEREQRLNNELESLKNILKNISKNETSN